SNRRPAISFFGAWVTPFEQLPFSNLASCFSDTFRLLPQFALQGRAHLSHGELEDLSLLHGRIPGTIVDVDQRDWPVAPEKGEHHAATGCGPSHALDERLREESSREVHRTGLAGLKGSGKGTAHFTVQGQAASELGERPSCGALPKCSDHRQLRATNHKE